MADNYPRLTSNDTDKINGKYPLAAPLPRHAAYYPSLSSAYGEATFTCPTISLLQTFVLQSTPAWSYRVNIQQASNLQAGIGVPHVMETPAIFGVPFGGGEGSSFETYNAAIVPVVMNYFISFVRDLDPNTYRYQDAPIWAPYGTQQARIVLQTNATAMETVPQDQQNRCGFWKGLAEAMEQ